MFVVKRTSNDKCYTSFCPFLTNLYIYNLIMSYIMMYVVAAAVVVAAAAVFVEIKFHSNIHSHDYRQIRHHLSLATSKKHK